LVGYFLDILDVLSHMHSMKPYPMIHGDIKPENIIICEHRAVLIDFGSSDGETGSSGFCAPERLSGLASNERSDLYSLGQVMHYCFTGSTRKIFSKANTRIDNDIYRIIEKATMKLPGERYSSAMEMANDLSRIVKSGENGDSGSACKRLICIPGNPHLACELAYIISDHFKTLLIDLDILSPGVDMLMGIRKFKVTSSDYGFGGEVEKSYGIIEGSKRNYPDILPAMCSYDAFEGIGDGVLGRIVEVNSGKYEAMVVSCSCFPYDCIFLEAGILCDHIIITIEKGPYDIRRYNSLVLHFERRQGINKDRIYYLGYGNDQSVTDGRVASVSSEVKWLGNIPVSKRRIAAHSEGLAFLPSKGSKEYKSMHRMLCKAQVM